jgi:acyl-CoA thioesterase FadM
MELPAWLWQALALFLLAHFAKVLPISYHVRVLALLAWHIAALLVRGRGLARPGDHVLTSPNIVTLCDLDYNMHVNNSVYPLEMDYARLPWLVDFVGGHRPRLFPLFTQGWRIANGAVSTYFYTEMKLHQAFTIRTRLGGCDRKWFYLIATFVSLDGGQVFASSVSRIVFKRGRLTLAPRAVMEAVGYAAADIDALEALGAPALPREGAPAADVLRSVGPCFSACGDELRAALGGAAAPAASPRAAAAAAHPKKEK